MPRTTPALALAFLAVSLSTTFALEPLQYNDPGLVVDLGVGLWAWPLPMDFDGDGDFDLVVNCPDTPSNGVYVFENVTGDTAATKMPVFKAGRRISKGVQNVEVSYVDGRARVLSPGMEYPEFLKSGLTDGKKLPLPANPHGSKVRANMWRLVDFDGDGLVDVVAGVGDWADYGWDNAYDASGNWTRGPLRGFVYFSKNIGTAEAPKYAAAVKVMAADQALETYGWPSPNFADFDGDWDLDLLCGEFRDGFTYFENIGTRTEPKYAPGKRLRTAAGKPLVMDLEMITPTTFDWDKDGDLDLIVGDEDGRVAFVENTGALAADKAPIFKEPVYFKQEAEALKCGALATPVGVDWDGDGDTDIVSGNSAGYIEFFENLSGPNVAKPKWAAPRRLEVGGVPFRVMAGENGSIQGPAEAKWGYTTFSVADWDGDGLPDIVLNSILGNIVWLKNVGTRAQPRLAPPEAIEVEWAGAQPALAWGWRKPEGKALLTQWRTTPLVFDFNHDGLADLAVLDAEGYLAFFERAKIGGKLVLRAPRRAFVDEAGAALRLATGSAGKSGRRKLCVTDWDGDGKFDLLLNSSNADFLRQVGEADGKWIFKNKGKLAEENIQGHDVSPTVVDFDGDGVPDFVGGAEDGRFYFLKNPRSK